jgi:hypothetical protein
VAVMMFLSANSAFSQYYNWRFLIPFRENKNWGFSDTLGNVRIKPAYDEANFFTNIEGYCYAPVSKENKKSFVTESGELVFPFSDSLVHLTGEYYYARDNNKYGIYHMRRKLLVPLLYDTFMFVKDYPRYKERDYYVLIPEHYRIIGRKDNKYYLINYFNIKTEEIPMPEPATKNTTLAGPATMNAPLIEQLDTVLVQVAPSGPITTISAAALFPQSHISVLRQNKKSGVVNNKSEVLVPCIYDSILIINDNLFITVRKKKYGAVFLNSVYKNIPNKYEKLEYIRCEPVTNAWCFLIFRAVKHNKKGYVGENGIEYFTD